MQIQYPSGTPVITLVGASLAFDIPKGSRGWSFSILTGSATVTVEGQTPVTVPAGFSDNDLATILKKITITTAAASSAYVRYLPKG